MLGVSESKTEQIAPEEEADLKGPEVAPEPKVAEEATEIEEKLNFAPLENEKVIAKMSKIFHDLKKKLPDLYIYRREGNWPCLVPMLGERRSLAYCYLTEKNVRIETAHVDEEGKTQRHTWCYSIREDGIVAHKEKVRRRVLVAEMVRFAKDRGWVE